ncbi:MAG: cyanophycinase [bacterium]
MFKKLIVPLFLIITIFSCSEHRENQSNRGLLMIVGGGKKPVSAIKTFVEYCNGGKILVVPSASAIPMESGPAAVELFKSHGAQNVDWLFIQDSAMAAADSVINKVKNATGIFFTGGVQTRLMKRIGGTPVESLVRKLYFQKSGAVGGTSAGAAIMSQIMITGDGDFTILKENNIVTAKGLGLLNNCIIDQHFIKRRRNNRLLSLAIEKQIPGIGIDESTAILYYANDAFKVVGEGSIVVYDTRKGYPQSVSDDEKLSMGNIKLSVLHREQWFSMKKGEIFFK